MAGRKPKRGTEPLRALFQEIIFVGVVDNKNCGGWRCGGASLSRFRAARPYRVHCGSRGLIHEGVDAIGFDETATSDLKAL